MASIRDVAAKMNILRPDLDFPLNGPSGLSGRIMRVMAGPRGVA